MKKNTKKSENVMGRGVGEKVCGEEEDEGGKNKSSNTIRRISENLENYYNAGPQISRQSNQKLVRKLEN